LTDYLYQQRGMTVEGATALMFVFGLGCLVGNIGGGVVGQWAYNQRKEFAALLMAFTTLLGFFPLYWLVNTPLEIATPSGGFTPLAGLIAFSGGIAAFTGPLVRAFVMNGTHTLPPFPLLVAC
jgi:predicted MFS family arabinose efflux permease